MAKFLTERRPERRSDDYACSSGYNNIIAVLDSPSSIYDYSSREKCTSGHCAGASTGLAVRPTVATSFRYSIIQSGLERDSKERSLCHTSGIVRK